ncbi:MAG TPA: hypothetical protein VOB72_04475 [Candidatus Dormibacteraeota bacterium]|nr:hypothetical protein [Candidatus Dormibacteraeota bacterium]
MIDELVETVLPGGAWLSAGLVVGVAFGSALRPIAVRVLAAGIETAERLQEVGAEAYEKAQDLVAEARHEREQAREQAREQEREEEAPMPTAPVAPRRPGRA